MTIITHYYVLKTPELADVAAEGGAGVGGGADGGGGGEAQPPAVLLSASAGTDQPGAVPSLCAGTPSISSNQYCAISLHTTRKLTMLLIYKCLCHALVLLLIEE